MLSEISLPCAHPGEAEMISEPPNVVDCVHLIQAEYLEMPGLNLTRSQFRRLWGLDEATCDALLDALVRVGFLRQTRSGGYVRAA